MSPRTRRVSKSRLLILGTAAATLLLLAASGSEPAPQDAAAPKQPAPQDAAPQDAAPAAPDKQVANRYMGAGKCMSCHKSEAGGDQYGHWLESKHAHAFEVLATKEAKAQAQKVGIEEPQKAEQCLRCHVTGFGQPEEAFNKGFKPELGVQCESCHGPGELHVKARFAAAAKAKDGKLEPPPAGEILTRPPATTCAGCHNKESPNFKGFCFQTFSKKIRHLDPRKPLSDERKAELEAECPHGEDCKCDHTADGKGCGK
jgi:hypothetical protein